MVRPDRFSHYVHCPRIRSITESALGISLASGPLGFLAASIEARTLTNAACLVAVSRAYHFVKNQRPSEFIHLIQTGECERLEREWIATIRNHAREIVSRNDVPNDIFPCFRRVSGT